MKSLLSIAMLCCCGLLSAQDFEESLETIQQTEAKASLKNRAFTSTSQTGNYDVTYHRLEFTSDPAVAFLEGTVTTYFKAKEAMNEVIFDLSQQMIVSEVLQRGAPLSFVQTSNDELKINLTTVQNTGVLDSLTIKYSGNPELSNLNSFEQTTHNGAPIFWTLSEPYGAKGWWPCKQDLTDKIDQIDVYITTPVANAAGQPYIAVSNGLEQSQIVNGSSKTTHYKHQYPIPAYLVAIAATNYQVYSHRVENNGQPFDIVNYVYPESFSAAQASTGVTVDIMNLFIDLFENYPYENEKYGHAQFGWNGGMEHTTVSFMGTFNRNLIAHELAHQWFGDKITCGSWKDIWLNEGFATYLSGLVYENLDGEATFTQWKQSRTESITSQPSGAVYLSDQDTTSVSRIFNSRLTYNKGAMVLHMLRKQIGDPDFFQALKNYLQAPEFAFDYAHTAEFIDLVEETSAQDLSEFFNDWLYKEGYPTYSVQWNQSDTSELYIKINQSQSHESVDFFEGPVTLRLISSSGNQEDVVLQVDENGQQFELQTNFMVESVLFDPDFDIVSKNNRVQKEATLLPVDQSFLIYPNPTRTKFKIRKPNALDIRHMYLFNSLGQLLLDLPYQEEIDVSAFAPGVLFLQLDTNEGLINKTLLKN